MNDQKEPSAQAVRAQKISPELQLQLLNTLPQIIIAVGRDHTLRYVNAKAELYFSASSTILLKLRLEDLFYFDSPVLSLVEQVQRGGSGISEYNVEIGSARHKHNELMDIQVTPMSNSNMSNSNALEDEEITILVMQPRSIAQKIERQLAHRGAARSVTGLASMLVHEIRNPLSGIRGAAQLLEGSVEHEDRALTKLICDETDRISRLVGRMEVFGDTSIADHQLLNIHAVLGHVLKVAKSGFAKDIEVIEDYDPSLPKLTGSWDLLVQMFLNLVKNAAESVSATGARGKIRGKIWLTSSYRPGVSFSVPGSTVKTSLPLQITIEDNGPGVSGDIRSILFDPFITTKANGTGLGLALVAKAVKDHGGVIEYEQRNERTIFKVLLPHHKNIIKNPEITSGKSK